MFSFTKLLQSHAFYDTICIWLVLNPHLVAHLAGTNGHPKQLMNDQHQPGKDLRYTNTVDASEIWRSPVDVGSLPPIIYKVLNISGGCLGLLPSTVYTSLRIIDPRKRNG